MRIEEYFTSVHRWLYTVMIPVTFYIKVMILGTFYIKVMILGTFYIKVMILGTFYIKVMFKMNFVSTKNVMKTFEKKM